MRTRRFKALNGLKEPYSRVVEKISIYDDNGKQIDCCIIQKNKDGKEFYYPSNPNDKFGLFTDKPKDAIECIRNGFGDAIERSKFLGFEFKNVVRFIDREYGESMRQKTIEGWKDAKFGYGVKFTYCDSLNGGRLVCKDNALESYDSSIEDILSFETFKEAESFIKEITEKCKEYKKEYLNLERTGDDDWDYENTVKPFFNRIEGRIKNGMNSIYWRVFAAMNDNTRYKIDVVQVVLP